MSLSKIVVHPKNGKIECSVCFEWVEERDMVRHAHTKHPEGDAREVICSLCDRRFKYKYELRRHMNNFPVERHPRPRPIECDICHRASPCTNKCSRCERRTCESCGAEGRPCDTCEYQARLQVAGSESF